MTIVRTNSHKMSLDRYDIMILVHCAEARIADLRHTAQMTDDDSVRDNINYVVDQFEAVTKRARGVAKYTNAFI